MREREARYGINTYQVRVSREISPSGILYVTADSLTVTPAGALILAVEVEPVENLEETDEGDIRRREDASGIDVTPGAVFAPGYWYSVVDVDSEDHRPTYIESD
jgi:hypothetical protein